MSLLTRLLTRAESLRLQAADLIAQADDLASAAAVLEAPAVVPPAEPEPEPALAPAGSYRVQQRQLFQPISGANIPARLPGQAPLTLEVVGPTQTHVEFGMGWQWANKGGDFIDANGVPQGAAPWATVNIDSVAVGESAEYSVDIASLIAESNRRDIALAFLLTCSAPRKIDSLFGAKPPRLVATYADGRVQTRSPLFVGGAAVSSPTQAAPQLALPCFFEFEPLAENPVTAVVYLQAQTIARNSNPTGRVWLLNPDRTIPGVRPAVLDAGELDEDIASLPSIIGAHRYADTDSENAYIYRDTRPTHLSNVGADESYSPELFGGAPDTTKYPYVGAGRWLNANGNITIARSHEIPHGPIAPGLGALRVAIPPDPQAVEGGYAPQAGWSISRLEMPLPIDRMGLCDHIFVRQYFSWDTPGYPDALDPSEVLAVYRGKDNTVPAWTSHGGKFGIVPTHDTAAGGFSGSSGGGGGWQMRLGWGFPVTGKPGPDSGGLLAAWHLWDFQSRHHPQGKSSAGSIQPMGWGKVGGVLYARRWYCVETELRLNSVDKPGVLPDGTPHIIAGRQQYWSADGELRAWIDGRLVWEDTGLIFRSLPTTPRPAGWNGRSLYPIRDLGVRSLLLNVYVGGTTPSVRPLNQFYAGLAYGSQYIGPMRGVGV